MAGRAVLFDLDNTLHDRDAALASFLTWQYDELGLSGSRIGEEAWRARFIELDRGGRVWKDVVYQTLCKEFSIRDAPADLLRQYEERFAEHVRERPQMLQTIRALKGRGWKVGVVTNGRMDFQRRTCEALKLHSQIDALVISEACGFRKPDPRIFLMALDEVGAVAKDSWFVGDDPIADVQSAKNAGMQAAWLRIHGRVTPDSPQAQINALPQIFGIVEP